MTCYFQNCDAKTVSKEHIPPKAFFPDDERHQLLTVRSCDAHNSAKSHNDLYVLAHICMNAAPSNRAREIFLTRVAPQLSYNDGKLRELLTEGAKRVSGGVAYRVDRRRLDEFFTALSCGLVFKSQKAQLPPNYRISHIYHQLEKSSGTHAEFEASVSEFYASCSEPLMNFGTPETRNERIYAAQIFGLAGYLGSITITHVFFGVFRVTSMLSMRPPLLAPHTPPGNNT